MKRSGKSTLLRHRAEEYFAPKQEPITAAELLLHELQVHQIELEMQNEQLRQAHLELEESRDRYVDLYEFSPAGYLNLSPEGLIEEINLTGAAILKVERNKLQHRRFTQFIAPEEQDRWHLHFMSVLKLNETQACELLLQHGDGSLFNARLTCLCLKTAGREAVVRIVLLDISENKRAEFLINEQLNELRRWQVAMQGREMRVLELKHEVNGLLVLAGQSPRYLSAE